MVKATNAKDLGDPVVTTIGADKVRVQTKPLAQDDIAKVRAAIAKEAGVSVDQVTSQQIGASWGQQIANKAILGADRVPRPGLPGDLGLLPRTQGLDGRDHRADARRH